MSLEDVTEEYRHQRQHAEHRNEEEDLSNFDPTVRCNLSRDHPRTAVGGLYRDFLGPVFVRSFSVWTIGKGRGCDVDRKNLLKNYLTLTEARNF